MLEDLARGSESDPAGAEPPPPRSSTDPKGPRRRWKRLALVVGGPLVVITAVVTVLVVQFQTIFLTSDDAAITAIANGDFTGKRSSSLIIAPAMWGHLLRVAYSLFPHVPWEGVYLYTLQIIAWSVIAIVAFTLRRRPPVAERIVVAAIICAVLPWMILRVSFTTTSLLIGVVGILVFAVGARAPGRIGTMYVVAGGVLLGLPDFIRVSSFLGLIAVFAPVLAIIAFKAGFRRSMVFAITVGLFAVVGYGTNRLEYRRDAQWTAFTKMNSARGALSQTPRLYNKNVSNSDLQKLGWTRNDLGLFADDVYPDPAVYSDNDIRELAKLSPLVRHTTSASYIYDVLRHSSDDGSGPVVSILAALGIVIALRRSRTVAALTLLSAVWVAGTLTVLMLYIRLPGRVGVPFEAGAALLALLVPVYLTKPRTKPGGRAKGWRKWSSLALIAFVAVFSAGPLGRGLASPSSISSQNDRGIDARQLLLTRVEKFDPDAIIMGRGDYFGTWVEPLSTTTQYSDPRVIPLGWAQNSPLFTARLARLGITDLYASLKTNPHVHLLGALVEAQSIELYYIQHRDTRAPLKASVTFLAHQFGSVQVYLTLWTVRQAFR